MSWSEKEQPTPFDTQTIEGLWMLDGDVMAKKYKQDRLVGHKYPLIHFPSGRQHELTQSRQIYTSRDELQATQELDPGQVEQVEVIHLFGNLLLPLQLSVDESFRYIQAQSEQHDVHVQHVNPNQLRVRSSGEETAPDYVLSFDEQTRRIANIRKYPDYAMDLIPGEIRAALPPLYSTENDGDQAIVSVKYFTPDAQWSWFPTEFDGDDLMFGLVDGFEAELGYFSVSELESVRGSLGLPIERDLYFEPQTLAEVREQISR